MTSLASCDDTQVKQGMRRDEKGEKDIRRNVLGEQYACAQGRHRSDKERHNAPVSERESIRKPGAEGFRPDRLSIVCGSFHPILRPKDS